MFVNGSMSKDNDRFAEAVIDLIYPSGIHSTCLMMGRLAGRDSEVTDPDVYKGRRPSILKVLVSNAPAG